MVSIHAVEDGIAVEQIPEGYRLGAVLVPSALATELAGQIEDLMSTIETLHGASVPQGLSAKNGRRVTRGISVKNLTPRQLEVLCLMAQAYSNSVIAEKLVLSRKTVENYIHGIYGTLNLLEENYMVRRVQAVLEYIDYTLWRPVNDNRVDREANNGGPNSVSMC